MYALRRLLFLPLSLLLLSLVCFGLRQITPGDPVSNVLPDADSRKVDSDPRAYDAVYRRAAASLGQDKPVFYFSIRNGALPDTLHRVARPRHRAMLRALTLEFGNWPAVQNFYLELQEIAYEPSTDLNTEVQTTALRLLLQDDPAALSSAIDQLSTLSGAQALARAHQELRQSRQRARLLLPRVQWHGMDNQYQHWLSQMAQGDFGISYVDRRPVARKIGMALKWTVLLNGIAILIVYLVSIPLGLYTASRAGSRLDQWITVLLFLLFGLPSFWVATLLANFFTTPAFGMDFFPSMTFGEIPEGASLWTYLRIRTSHLFLPVMCLAYPSWAYVSRLLRQSAIKEMGQAYVKTARMKGVTTRRILWRHVLRNASFPIITLLGSLLPALLAGSVLIERIFNLPGIGQLLFNSANNRDWPVVITLILLNGLLTAIGLLIADLTYSFADPRVKLNGQDQPQTLSQ
ncbi:MAG: ABC transporter permease [Bacteroidota bacterium]